ncbi:hypothetical protein E1294_45925 [Nonomuraea diastatica]|uniref:RNA ligase domain-containing protein n=1 Tax=Nonomuraea diastatica TaxID=1848329 RepID=A0A4R4VZM2_9ACTN|nr:hypothetical protein E1294_45925 [Nonomuraea diastatica]
MPFPKIPVASSAAVAANGIWIATEKIHGAQMVIAYDGRELRIGKRKAWLRGEEAFFGWQLLRGELEQAARAALSLGGTVVRNRGMGGACGGWLAVTSHLRRVLRRLSAR